MMQEELSIYDQFLSFDHTNNIHVECCPRDIAKGKTSFYITDAERGELTDTLNDAAVLLMEFYYRKLKHPKYDFWNDVAAAEILHWTPKKVERTRLQLVNANWIKRIKYVQPTTKAKLTTFYIGKIACGKILSAEQFTANEKKKVQLQQKIINHLGMNNWEEVTAKHSPTELGDIIQILLNQEQ